MTAVISSTAASDSRKLAPMNSNAPRIFPFDLIGKHPAPRMLDLIEIGGSGKFVALNCALQAGSPVTQTRSIRPSFGTDIPLLDDVESGGFCASEPHSPSRIIACVCSSKLHR